MVKKKLNKQELEEKILQVVDYYAVPLSISQIKNKLKEKFDISLSPQIVKGLLLKLKKEGKIL